MSIPLPDCVWHGPVDTPIVYAWRNGNEWLYVGSSNKGLQRPFSKNHLVFKNDVISDVNSTLSIWRLESPAKALELEANFIRTFNPRFNQRSGFCDSEYVTVVCTNCGRERLQQIPLKLPVICGRCRYVQDNLANIITKLA